MLSPNYYSPPRRAYDNVTIESPKAHDSQYYLLAQEYKLKFEKSQNQVLTLQNMLHNMDLYYRMLFRSKNIHSDLETAILNLEKENAELKSQYSDNFDPSSGEMALRKQLAEVLEENAKLHREIFENSTHEVAAITEASNLLDHDAEATIENASMLSKIQMLESEKNELQNEIENLKEKLKLSDDLNEKLQEEMDNSKFDLDELNKENEQKDQEILQLKNKIDPLELELSQCKDVINQFHQYLQSQEGKSIDNLSQSMTEFGNMESLTNENQELRDEKEKLINELNDLKTEIENLQQINEELKETNENLQDENDKFHDAIDENSNLIDKLENANNEIQNQRNKVEDLNNEIDDFLNDVDQPDFDSVKSSLESLKKINEEQTEQISNLFEQNQSLEKEITKYRNIVYKTIQTSPKSPMTRIDDFKRLKEEVNKLTIQNQILSAENDAFKKQADNTRKQQSYSPSNELKAEINKLKQRIISLEEENSRLEQDNENLRNNQDISNSDSIDMLASPPFNPSSKLQIEDERLKKFVNDTPISSRNEITPKKISPQNNQVITRLNSQLHRSNEERVKIMNLYDSLRHEDDKIKSELQSLKKENEELKKKIEISNQLYSREKREKDTFIRQQQTEISQLKKDLLSARQTSILQSSQDYSTEKFQNIIDNMENVKKTIPQTTGLRKSIELFIQTTSEMFSDLRKGTKACIIASTKFTKNPHLKVVFSQAEKMALLQLKKRYNVSFNKHDSMSEDELDSDFGSTISPIKKKITFGPPENQEYNNLVDQLQVLVDRIWSYFAHIDAPQLGMVIRSGKPVNKIINEVVKVLDNGITKLSEKNEIQASQDFLIDPHSIKALEEFCRTMKEHKQCLEDGQKEIFELLGYQDEE